MRWIISSVIFILYSFYTFAATDAKDILSETVLQQGNIYLITIANFEDSPVEWVGIQLRDDVNVCEEGYKLFFPDGKVDVSKIKIYACIDGIERVPNVIGITYHKNCFNVTCSFRNEKVNHVIIGYWKGVKINFSLFTLPIADDKSQ